MNPSPIRLFIAVPVPQYLKEALSRFHERWHTQFPFQKWTHPADYHLTLKFLGDTDEFTMRRIRETLPTVTRHTVPFSLELKGLGMFGPARAPQIFWAGIGGDTKALHRLQQTVEETVVTLGYPAEHRPFRPHLTLARRYRGSVPPDITLLEQTAGLLSGEPAWTVYEIVLYESRIGRQPMYVPLESLPFAVSSGGSEGD